MPGEEEYRVWLEQIEARVQALNVKAASAGVALETVLSEMLSLVTSGETRLVFAGHFKAGKSTLLNAALGRPLLPTDALPETGAACVLRAGDQDSALIVTADARQVLPCTTEAIKHAIALLSATGERRTEVGMIDSIEIQLAHSLLPPGVCWIDTPGINDSTAMDARAVASARAGDVLLWVLNSKQFLAEVEAAFLADHIAAKGPGSVVFVLNVFLDQDDLPAWQAYRQRQVPRLRAKFADVAPKIGLDPASPPPMVPISARAVGSLAPNGDAGPALSADSDFGASELRTLLAQLACSAQPRIRHTRCLHAATVLKGIAADMTQRSEVESVRLKKAQTAWKSRSRKLENQSKTYAKTVTESVDTCLAALQTELETLRTSLTAAPGVASHSHDTPETTGQRLNAALAAASEAPTEALLRAAAFTLRQTDCKPLKKAQQAQIRKQMAAKPVCFEVPAAQIDRADVLKGAGVGAVAVGMVPGIGHLLGGLIGAGVGYLKARGEAEHRHVEMLTAQLDAAILEAVEALPVRRKTLIACLLKWGIALKPLPDAPDLRPLDALCSRRNGLRQLAEEASRFADEALSEI